MTVATFRFSDYKILKDLGQGAFAEVKLAQHKETNELVALKIYRFPDEDNAIYEADFMREIGLMATLHHPCIVGFRGVLETRPGKDMELAYATEYLVNGSLSDILDRVYMGEALEGFGPTQKSMIAYGVASAMKYLHKSARKSGSVMHRDLKSGNILLDEKFRPKIADFGFAKIVREKEEEREKRNTQQRGSWPWMAPEVMTGTSYGPEADVFSYAMILYELAAGYIPFVGFVNSAQYFNAVAIEHQRPPLPDGNQDILELAKLCWPQDPAERLTFKQVVDVIKSRQCLFDGTDVDVFQKYVEEIDGSKR